MTHKLKVTVSDSLADMIKLIDIVRHEIADAQVSMIDEYMYGRTRTEVLAYDMTMEFPQAYHVKPYMSSQGPILDTSLTYMVESRLEQVGLLIRPEAGAISGEFAYFVAHITCPDTMCASIYVPQAIKHMEQEQFHVFDKGLQ